MGGKRALVSVRCQHKKLKLQFRTAKWSTFGLGIKSVVSATKILMSGTVIGSIRAGLLVTTIKIFLHRMEDDVNALETSIPSHIE